jgi:hypothetical protein
VVAVALEGDDFGVVDEPVDHGGSDDIVAEDLSPPAVARGSVSRVDDIVRPSSVFAVASLRPQRSAWQTADRDRSVS